MMNKYLILAVIVGAIALSVLLWPAQRTVTLTNLPWQIETLAGGGSRVFGITLGQTTVGEAEQALNAEAEVGLFQAPGGELSLEAYYGKIELGRIIARVVASIEAEPQTLGQLREQAVGRRPMPSGAYRFELSQEALARARALPVAGITYSPSHVRLDKPTLEERFGEPAEVLGGGEEQQYWLYPAKGLAIIRGSQGSTVLEYVRPREFERLRERLAGLRSASGTD